MHLGGTLNYYELLFLYKAGGAVVKRSTLDLCLEMDSSWPILCGAEIHVGLGPHYPSQ